MVEPLFLAHLGALERRLPLLIPDVKAPSHWSELFWRSSPTGAPLLSVLFAAQHGKKRYAAKTDSEMQNFFFFNFTILYWFCQISKWIRHRYTCVPHPEPSSLLLPHTIPLGRPSAPAPSIQYHASNLDWRLIPYMILYVFQCHSPKSSHPLPLPQSPKDCAKLLYCSPLLLNVCFSSVAQSCPTLCDPMNRSTPRPPCP